MSRTESCWLITGAFSLTLLGLLGFNGSIWASDLTESSAGPRSRDRQHGQPENEDASRLREGTVISDHLGYFLQNGEGAKFVTVDGLELGGLPNLNLERVVRMLKSTEDPKSVRWSVSGTVTEFSGRNYLLIRRAVYKSSSPPAPDQLSN